MLGADNSDPNERLNGSGRIGRLSGEMTGPQMEEAPQLSLTRPLRPRRWGTKLGPGLNLPAEIAVQFGKRHSSRTCGFRPIAKTISASIFTGRLANLRAIIANGAEESSPQTLP